MSLVFLFSSQKRGRGYLSRGILNPDPLSDEGMGRGCRAGIILSDTDGLPRVTVNNREETNVKAFKPVALHQTDGMGQRPEGSSAVPHLRATD